MLPAGTFDGKVSLITGGGTGIGFAMASEIVRLGGKVILVSRKAEHLEPAAESIRKAVGRDDAASFYALDIRQPEAIQEMADRVVAEHQHIDCLVNNAAGNFISRAEDLTINGWNSVINIGLNLSFTKSAESKTGLGRGLGPGGRSRSRPGEMLKTMDLIRETTWTPSGVRFPGPSPSPHPSPAFDSQHFSSREKS